MVIAQQVVSCDCSAVLLLDDYVWSILQVIRMAEQPGILIWSKYFFTNNIFIHLLSLYLVF